MTKEKKIICLLVGVIAGMLIGVVWSTRWADAKMVKEYKGKYIASSYTAASNTPSGTHATASGHRATEGVTVAVDDRTPIAEMGSKIVLKWKMRVRKGKKWKWKWKAHTFWVQDRGHFGHLNAGRRQLDVFFETHGWGLREVKVYVYRPETKKERRERLRKKRLRQEERARKRKQARQRGEFYFFYEPMLMPWQIVTDRTYISGGVARVSWKWLDVIGTKQGLGNVVLTGDRSCLFGRYERFAEIHEEAKG